MEWINRYTELLNAQGIQYLRFGDLLLREYGQIIIPMGPVLQVEPKEAVDVKKVFRKLKGKLIWWSYIKEDLGNNDWYAVIKDKHTEISNYKSANVRNQIKKGLKLNEIKKISIKFLMENGFTVYNKAIEGFGSKYRKPEFVYQSELSKYAGFEDIVHFWGIFNESELIGYSLVYCYDKVEANISEIRIDPNYNKSYPLYALIHFLSLEYIENLRFNCISDGYRNLLHKTNIQNLLINKFGFKKVGLTIEMAIRFPWNIFIICLNPFRSLIRNSPVVAVLNLYSIFMNQKRLPK